MHRVRIYHPRYPALFDSHVDKALWRFPRHVPAGGRFGPPVGRSPGGIAARRSCRRPDGSSGVATRPLARPWHGTIRLVLRRPAGHHQDGLARVVRDRDAVAAAHRPTGSGFRAPAAGRSRPPSSHLLPRAGAAKSGDAAPARSRRSCDAMRSRQAVTQAPSATGAKFAPAADGFFVSG